MDTIHRSLIHWPAFAATVLLAGCGLAEDAATEFTHINLADQADKLQQDFNAHSDQVRLVFIVGPT